MRVPSWAAALGTPALHGGEAGQPGTRCPPAAGAALAFLPRLHAPLPRRTLTPCAGSDVVSIEPLVADEATACPPFDFPKVSPLLRGQPHRRAGRAAPSGAWYAEPPRCQRWLGAVHLLRAVASCPALRPPTACAARHIPRPELLAPSFFLPRADTCGAPARCAPPTRTMR